MFAATLHIPVRTTEIVLITAAEAAALAVAVAVSSAAVESTVLTDQHDRWVTEEVVTRTVVSPAVVTSARAVSTIRDPSRAPVEEVATSSEDRR